MSRRCPLPESLYPPWGPIDPPDPEPEPDPYCSICGGTGLNGDEPCPRCYPDFN